MLKVERYKLPEWESLDPKQAAEIAGEFTKRAIEKTVGDENHKYGVKFEQVIPELSDILK